MHQSYLDFSPFASIRAFFAQFECAPLSSIIRQGVQRRAINGLGGIGKTQIAIEYAYRYAQNYQFVLWVSAATEKTILTELGQLASLLQLPERDAKDDQVRVRAVICWLTEHRNWLLILDNADDIAMVSDYLPGSYKVNGHLLLTTRSQHTSFVAQPIRIETMEQEEATTLLLRRAGRLVSDTPLEQATPQDRSDAAIIVTILDGLPLAIDQAGAYIEETQSNFSAYLTLYQQRRNDLLKRRGSLPTGHPESVATTWSLSFQSLEQNNPPAADLLRLCS